MRMDPLYKNSVSIMLTAFATSGFGLIFWILAAKLYPIKDVGIATAMISSIIMLVILSGLGLDFSLVRFFPNYVDKSSALSTCIIITTIFALIFGIIFILGLDLWSQELCLLKSKIAVIYFIILAANSIQNLSQNAFIAMRRAEINFIESLILGSRVVILFPLASLGAIGILGAYGISFILANFIALGIFAKFNITPVIKIDVRFLKEISHFSAGNYFSALLASIPNLIMPILVLNILGASETARYYIAFSIASLLSTIPTAISTSLFVEGSHGAPLRKTFFKSILAASFILVLGVMLLEFFGSYLLGSIGGDYIEGFKLLKLMALSSFLITPVLLYLSIKRVQKEINILIYISGLMSTLFLALSCQFMVWFGLIGIGYAQIISYGVGLMIIIFLTFRTLTPVFRCCVD